MYTALIAFIWYEGDEEEKNLNTLLDLLNESETREEDETYQNPVDMMFQELEERDPQHFAVRQYKKYKMAAGETTPTQLRKNLGMTHSTFYRYRKTFYEKYPELSNSAN